MAPSKASIKNAKKRANKKETNGEGEANDESPAMAAASAGVDKLSIQQQDEVASSSADEPAKRIRAIQKKLRQVGGKGEEAGKGPMITTGTQHIAPPPHTQKC